MTVFAETIIQAIGDYRTILRKCKDVDQVARVAKLSKLNLKKINVFSDDVVLYNTAQSVLEDIRETFHVPEQGYYSYSGIENYYTALNEFLSQYDIDTEEDVVVHRAQRASRAILNAIQELNGKPAHLLNDAIKEQVYDCHLVIINNANEEQVEIYRENLVKLKANAPLFYTDLLRHFDVNMQEMREAA
jgi:hypothetical protein